MQESRFFETHLGKGVGGEGRGEGFYLGVLMLNKLNTALCSPVTAVQIFDYG